MATGSVSALESDNWQLISTTTLNGSSQYTLASGISGYKSLMVVWRVTDKQSSGGAYIRFNGDSTSRNYGSQAVWNSGNYVYSTTAIALTGNVGFAYETGYAIFENTNQSIIPVTVKVAGSNAVNVVTGLWTGYAPVTSVGFVDENGYSWTTGTIKLYGIAG